METEIEIPPGLTRVWKAIVAAVFTGFINFGLGFYSGHMTARVQMREVRVEVPPPALCLDEMIRLQKSEDREHIACSHPDQHGVYQNVNFGDYDHGHYLLCTCGAHSSLDFEGGAK